MRTDFFRNCHLSFVIGDVSVECLAQATTDET